MIKKQLERIKILRELQKLEEEEKEKIGKEKENSFSEILKLPEIGETVDRFSNMFGFNSNDHGYSGELKNIKKNLC